MHHNVFARAGATAALAMACAFAGSPATAAVFTVGNAGTHASVEAALNAATTAEGDDEVRVQVGTWVGTTIVFGGVDERTELSGGWDPTFTTQTEDPSLTVLDANYAGRVLDASWSAGALVVRNLSFARGESITNGALRIDARNAASITIADCIVRDSRTSTANSSEGGGASLVAFSTASILMTRCAVHGNRVVTTSQGSGGGVYIAALDSATVQLEASSVHDNAVEGTTHASGGGVAIHGFGAGTVRVLDTRIENNTLVTGASTNGAGLVAWQGQGPMDSTAQIELRRLQVQGNSTSGGFATGVQLLLESSHDGSIVLGDSLVADGIGTQGVRANADGAAKARLVNVTAFNNIETDFWAMGATEVANSLFGSVINPQHPMVATLVDPAPGFVDAANGDYRLLLTSPAVGAGTSTPAGGLGATDLDGNARIIGPDVDLGAYEADDPTLFVDGFEDD